MSTGTTNGTNDTEAEAKVRRQQWLMRLADEMEKLAPLMPMQFLPVSDEDTPEWVRRVEAEFAKAMFPAVRLKKGRDITPKRMGALIGHQCANAVWMMEWFASDVELPAKMLPEPENPELEKKARENLICIIGKWYPAMCRYAKRALCSCVDQTYEDMSNFLQGFADGFARKPKTFKIGEMGTTATEIYLFILWLWRLIERLESVAHLHQVLVKVFGPQRAGDLKRTEKMCQRVGLRYRRPGRPPASG